MVEFFGYIVLILMIGVMGILAMGYESRRNYATLISPVCLIALLFAMAWTINFCINMGIIR